MQLIKSCICVGVPCLFRHIIRTGNGGSLKLLRMTLSLLVVIPLVIRQDNIWANFRFSAVVATVVRPVAIITCGLRCISTEVFVVTKG